MGCSTLKLMTSLSLRSLHFLSITSECLRQGLQGIASLGTVTTFECLSPLRDNITSFYPFQFNCVILSTSVRSWSGGPSSSSPVSNPIIIIASIMHYHHRRGTNEGLIIITIVISIIVIIIVSIVSTINLIIIIVIVIIIISHHS